MSPQHMFWFYIITSFSSVSKAATSLEHETNETNFNLQGGVKLSSNITTFEPQLVSSDIRSEVQDVSSFLPKSTINLDVDFNEDKSTESKNVSSHSLNRNSDLLGEVSMSFVDNCEHAMKNNLSGIVKSTTNDETPIQDKDGPTSFLRSSTKEHVSSEHSADVDTGAILADDVPDYYDEEEYVTGIEPEEGNAKKEVNDNEEVRNNKELLSGSEADDIPLSELTSQENYGVTHATDVSAQSKLLAGEIQDSYSITTSSTAMTIQSEPDHSTQHSASEHTTVSYAEDMFYTAKILSESVETLYTETSTTGTMTDRMKTLSSMEIRGGIHHAATSEAPAERYRTLKHTLRRSREPSSSPNQVENDYDDDYYEVWRRNRDRSTTVSATESEEIKITSDKSQRAYVPYFPTWQDAEHTFDTETVKSIYTSDEVINAAVDHDIAEREEGVRRGTGPRKYSVSMQNMPFPTWQEAEHTFGTETVKNFYISGEVTNAAVDHDSTVNEEGARATTGDRKPPASVQDVSYFPTEQDAKHIYGTGTVRNIYTSEEVTNATADHDSTVREESVRATTGAGRPTVSLQDGTTSENSPQTVKRELVFRVLQEVDILNNNATLRHWEENNSIATTNSGNSAVTKSPMSTSRRTSYTKTNKYNGLTTYSEASTTPQELATLKEYEEESKKSVHNIESASEFDFRAQRESLREVFTISDDYGACEGCDAETAHTKADREQATVLQLSTKQNLPSAVSNIPEDYYMCTDCVEEDTNTTVFNDRVKIAPETQKQQGEDWNKELAKNKSREGKKKELRIMANETIRRKSQNFQGKISLTTINSTSIRETSFSDYPWFVIIETSDKGMRCAGAMVTPRWLLTASSCLRTDDARTDAYSAPVEVTVNVTGKEYRTVVAVFAPGGGVALARLPEPPESALRMTGRLDLAEAAPPALWARCVLLGMGRGEIGDLKTLVCPEHIFAVGAWAQAPEDYLGQPGGSDGSSSRMVRAPCSADPGAPLACHRKHVARGGLRSSPSVAAEPPENEPAQLVLVGVSQRDNSPGVACRGSSVDYWSVASLQQWVEQAIASKNREMQRISGRREVLPPDPYTQRLQRLRLEGSLPEPMYSRASARSRRLLLPLLAAASAFRVLLGS